MKPWVASAVYFSNHLNDLKRFYEKLQPTPWDKRIFCQGCIRQVEAEEGIWVDLNKLPRDVYALPPDGEVKEEGE
jgi:hypothetical protein